MRRDIRVELLSDARLLQGVRSLMRAYLQGLGFSRERMSDIVLAVDEACTNAIRHSYGGRADGRVTLTLRSNAQWIELQVADMGEPAPREKVARRELARPTRETAQPGGLGVQLMYQVFDEVEFAPGEKRGNRVTMRLKRPQERIG